MTMLARRGDDGQCSLDMGLFRPRHYKCLQVHLGLGPFYTDVSRKKMRIV